MLTEAHGRDAQVIEQDAGRGAGIVGQPWLVAAPASVFAIISVPFLAIVQLFSYIPPANL